MDIKLNFWMQPIQNIIVSSFYSPFEKVFLDKKRLQNENRKLNTKLENKRPCLKLCPLNKKKLQDKIENSHSHYPLTKESNKIRLKT